MKGRRLKGKTIKKVHQVYLPNEPGRRGCWSTEAIEFTDGTWLRFVTIETNYEYGTKLVYPAKPMTATTTTPAD